MFHEKFYLDTILSLEDDAITIVDTNQQVLFWNAAAVQTYNIDQSAILHQPITNYFHSDDLIVLQVLASREPVKNTYHQPREDKHVVINAAPVYNENQELVGAASIERDVTQIVKLNNNLETTAAELNELRQRVNMNHEETPFSKLKGKSLSLQQTIQIARKAAKTTATTLILGESGTGKEICARAIHEASNRKNGPFVPVNCGAIPSALFESELLGYEGGSFTGAEKNGKAGKIEMADGGTLFLDEVGELPLDMQVKLLRVLQENRIYRIGDSTGRKVDVRFVAATNQNLIQLMEDKEFRSDLFYRLNVIQLTMPPLRERIDDIPGLVRLFLKQFAIQHQVPTPEMKQDAIHILLEYNWPGNVRELRNFIERIVILSEKPFIVKQDVLDYFPNPALQQNRIVPETSHLLPQEKAAMEKDRIAKMLKKTNGNKALTAKKLGISRMTLYNKIKKYGIL
ncbi:sigma 54-interacting transcriptional regulator [Oceanobacillus sp. FSL K6-2867]|uniref:sigma-54 interaction domain-containing protein n=1 Tax=Oceanobacillus sp. FSL K6-2867 TaxID=2954748 RepID=UPI0030D6EBE5